jgi:hypothetical protein
LSRRTLQNEPREYAGELTGDVAARARRLGSATRDRIIGQLDPAALEHTRHQARS